MKDIYIYISRRNCSRGQSSVKQQTSEYPKLFQGYADVTDADNSRGCGTSGPWPPPFCYPCRSNAYTRGRRAVKSTHCPQGLQHRRQHKYHPSDTGCRPGHFTLLPSGSDVGRSDPCEGGDLRVHSQCSASATAGWTKVIKDISSKGLTVCRLCPVL